MVFGRPKNHVLKTLAFCLAEMQRGVWGAAAPPGGLGEIRLPE
jgi:hypothetical protein